jgi:predicted nucleotidyltransferase
VFNCILRELNAGAFPCNAEALFPAVAASFTLNFTAGDRDIHDASGGLYNRLKNKCLEATSINSLVELTATKKYTTARIRRGIWYSLLGVTSSDVRVMPEYTQVLAMDKHGQALLKRIKKSSSISVLTKPSDTPSSPIGVKQKELSDKADAISQLSKPTGSPTGSIYKRTPFVKKDV